MKTYIIMPAYNEEKRIGETLKAYCEYFCYWDINPVKIIVAINNTTDNTENIVREWEDKYPWLLSHITLPGAGKGYAIIEGWKEALKESLSIHEEIYIGFVDADNATAPEAYADLIVQLHNNPNIDGAIASRYITGAQVNPRQTWQRILVSRIFNKMIRSLFPISLHFRDTQCGCKIFRRKVIDDILNDLGLTKWAFDVNLLYSANQKEYIVKEFPTIWSDVKYSKINLTSAGPKMTLAIIRLRLLNSPFTFIVKIYDEITSYLWRSWVVRSKAKLSRIKHSKVWYGKEKK